MLNEADSDQGRGEVDGEAGGKVKDAGSASFSKRLDVLRRTPDDRQRIFKIIVPASFDGR